MRAVIFKGPLNVVLEDRPIPTIKDPKDIIVKVEYSALCGRYKKNQIFSNGLY
jgi:threonine dehydrogenase-like Zn-dependent dehydrogenase